MISYKKASLRIAETWFDENANGVQVDIIRHFQHPNPIAEAQCSPFHTIVIDLDKDPDLLLARMNRVTRYEIRRADKDNLTHQMWLATDSNCLVEFLRFYDAFAAQTGLPKRRSVRLEKFAEAGALSLSVVRGKEGVPFVWHAYYRTNERVRLLHSASLERDSGHRNLLGRANRYHHWQDVLAFRAQGTKIFDLGGWYDGISDSKKLSINQFKEGFGGQIVVDYNCINGLTRLGKTAVWLYARMRTGA